METTLSKDDFLGSIIGDSTDNTDAYYSDEQDVDIDDGTYPATVIDMSYQNIITRYNTHADLYKPTYQISKGIHKGATIVDKGIWRFKSEPTGIKNKSNRGNILYKKMLDIFDIKLEQVEVDGVILKRLPPLSKESIKGKSVLIDVVDDTYKTSYGKSFGKVAILNGVWKRDEQKEESK
tara:strand:- start:1550 stop:2086 length:537 start_codon:yes stop_codon:yes gene_type:complete